MGRTTDALIELRSHVDHLNMIQVGINARIGNHIVKHDERLEKLEAKAADIDRHVLGAFGKAIEAHFQRIDARKADDDSETEAATIDSGTVRRAALNEAANEVKRIETPEDCSPDWMQGFCDGTMKARRAIRELAENDDG